MAMKVLVITPLVLKKLANGLSIEVTAMGVRLVPNDEIKNSLTRQEAPPAESGPICLTCGMMMTVNGSCYKCSNCGSTSGCS